METKLEFVRHDKFGYLTFCPTNIGTGLRASVHVKVPKTADSGKLKEICEGLNLQPRGKLLKTSQKIFILENFYLLKVSMVNILNQLAVFTISQTKFVLVELNGI
jgi:protein-arginine kinase